MTFPDFDLELKTLGKRREECAPRVTAVKQPSELPHGRGEWPSLPRYLLAELERAGVEAAEARVRVAWFNSVAGNQKRMELFEQLPETWSPEQQTLLREFVDRGWGYSDAAREVMRRCAEREHHVGGF